MTIDRSDIMGRSKCARLRKAGASGDSAKKFQRGAVSVPLYASYRDSFLYGYQA
jgi:hypothetical protein